MMKYLQRLGKSLMLPVATLPVAAILMGIGYWIDPTGWGANNIISAFLLKAGGSIIDNMPILFAIGVAVGMSDDKEGTSALAGLVSFLVITTVLSSGSVGTYYKALGITGDVPAAFGKISVQFTGIVAGLIGGHTYNVFKNTKLPMWLSFFSGRRSVAIMTAVFSLIFCVPMFFVWPFLYGALTSFGEMIVNAGAVGAGIYGFFNRLLIPVGLHHALNSIFWFDLAGISDINRFWGAEGFELIKTNIGLFADTPVTGSYMSGFFPIMMFGLPGAAAAFYFTAKPEKKSEVLGLVASAALASFFTGVTEPIEFAFMFLSPVLYVVHALLTGVFVAVTALLPTRAGFNFSAGVVDYILSAKAPGHINIYLLLVLGLFAFVIYFVVFVVLIKALNLKTPGREDDAEVTVGGKAVSGEEKYNLLGTEIYKALGGKDNVKLIDNCITRLRLDLVDSSKVDEAKIKALGVAGLLKPSKDTMQIIIGPDVQFVADVMRKLHK